MRAFWKFAAGVGTALSVASVAAHAANESWVARNGTDTGNCVLNSPCRTFAYALSQTNANGSINVLSPGNYGPLTITKSISIVAQGIEAVINTAVDGNAIRVEAGASASVSLRGLTIDLRGTTNTAISFLSGGSLQVHDCIIRKAVTGIAFMPGSGSPELYVGNTLITDSSSTGIFVQPAGTAGARATLERVRVHNGSSFGMDFNGFATTGAIEANLRDTVVFGHNQAGIAARESGGGSTTVIIDHSASMNNAAGLFAFGANAKIQIGNSTLGGNFKAFDAIGGVIESYGTNQANGNTNDSNPTTTIATK